MANNTKNEQPTAGSWYRDTLERRFEVVSIDEESGLIQIAYENGDQGELTLADWRHVMLDHEGAPEDYLTSPDSDDER
jgi:hypothetical protein